MDYSKRTSQLRFQVLNVRYLKSSQGEPNGIHFIVVHPHNNTTLLILHHPPPPQSLLQKKNCKQLQKLCYWRNNHSTTAPLKRESSLITEGSHLNKAPSNRYSLLKRKVARYAQSN